MKVVVDDEIVFIDDDSDGVLIKSLNLFFIL